MTIFYNLWCVFNHSLKVLIFLFLLTHFIGCEKQNPSPNDPLIFERKHNEGDQAPNTAYQILGFDNINSLSSLIIAPSAEEQETVTACADISFSTNMVQISVLKLDGDWESFCFLSFEIQNVLSDLGWTSIEISETIENLFNPMVVYGAYSYPISLHLYNSLNLDPLIYTDCFYNIVAIRKGPYFNPIPDDVIIDPPTCGPGIMERIYKGNSFVEPTGCLTAISAANNIRLRLKEGGSTSTDIILSINSVTLIVSILIDAGWTEDEALLFLDKFSKGHLAPSKFFEIVQYHIIPHHPDFLALDEGTIVNRYFYSVGLSMIDSFLDPTSAASLAIYGKAKLYCSPYQPTLD